MSGPASTSVTTTAAVASLATMMPFGVSLSTLVLGGACFFAGSCARTGLALYKKLDGNDPVSIAMFIRAMAMLLCTTPLAAVASCVTFLAAHVIGIQADAALGGLLLIMGVRGPEGFEWILSTVTNIFTKLAPGNKTGGSGT
jgi:hypothetical protein